jgi:O-antigen ligase
MNMPVQNSLRLRKVDNPRRVPPEQAAKPKRKYSKNALIAMGLWTLLWLGYNTIPEFVLDPNFPANTTMLIHGVRAFFPMLAAWISLLIILSRPQRVVPWISGPLGLILIYAVTGLVATVIFVDDPLDGLYYGANYLAIVLVLLAIVSVGDPLPDLHRVLRLTWIVGIFFTLSMLGAVPFLRGVGGEGPAGMQAYNGAGQIMGMATSRNTGFARYAAVSALVALPGFLSKSRRIVRIMWGGLFLLSCYALVIANGRTEILAFILGAVIVFARQKSRRTLFVIAGIGAGIVLAFAGFYGGFFRYFTRTGHLDATLTGRTTTWELGLQVLGSSPLVGLGFQSDRLYLGIHMHNAYLHVLFQAGLLGGGAILIALATVWYYLIKYFFLRQPADKSLIPVEIPAVFTFITISSITESTFAYYSAAWLLSAPIVAYVMALDRHMKRLSFKAYKERTFRERLTRRASRGFGYGLEVEPSPAGGQTSS